MHVSDPVPPVHVAHVTSSMPVADDLYLDGTPAEAFRVGVFRNVDVYLPATDLSAGILHNVFAGIRAGVAHANLGTEGQNRRIGGYDSRSRLCAGRGLARNGIRRRREVGLFPGRLRRSHAHGRPTTAKLSNSTQAECHDKVPGTAGHWQNFAECTSARHEAHRPGRLALRRTDLLFFTLCSLRPQHAPWLVDVAMPPHAGAICGDSTLVIPIRLVEAVKRPCRGTNQAADARALAGSTATPGDCPRRGAETGTDRASEQRVLEGLTRPVASRTRVTIAGLDCRP